MAQAPRASRGKTIALLAVAVSVACIALLLLFGRPTPAPREAASPLPAPPRAAATVEPDPEPEAMDAARSEPRGSSPRAPAREAESELPADRDAEAVAEAQIEDALEEEVPAAPSGSGSLPAGSGPLEIGIVVPDGFELPEGFLRHQQVTDDGQELEPILVFGPDYELRDAAGQPIPLPENRVVPPELAPPGLPIRMLELPPTRE